MNHSEIEDYLVFLALSPEDIKAAKELLAQESDVQPGIWYVRQDRPPAAVVLFERTK